MSQFFLCVKNPVLGFFDKKESKKSFVSFITDWCIKFFRFFTKVTAADEILVWVFLGQEGPKMDLELGFFKYDFSSTKKIWDIFRALCCNNFLQKIKSEKLHALFCQETWKALLRPHFPKNYINLFFNLYPTLALSKHQKSKVLCIDFS